MNRMNLNQEAALSSKKVGDPAVVNNNARSYI